MLSPEFTYVEELKALKHPWSYICKKYNEDFGGNLKPTTLQKRYERENSSREAMVGNIVDKAVAIIKAEPVKPTELARRLNLDMNGLEGLLDDLLNSGSAIKFHKDYLIMDKLMVPDRKELDISHLLRVGEWQKVGIYSDAHFCGIHEQIPLMHELYKIFEEEHVICAVDAGDLCVGDGHVYKGQIQEMKIIGADKQIDYVVNTHPFGSFKTYKIAGNHDLSFFKSAGIDIVKSICDKRDDFEYLGKLSATLNLGGVKINLLHPDGGNSLAKTYKMQKVIDAMPDNDKPNVLVMGHLHCFSHLPDYRGVLGIMPGCVEAQSEYLKRKGLMPDLGGVLLEFKTAVVDGEVKIVRHRVEFINFNSFVR